MGTSGIQDGAPASGLRAMDICMVGSKPRVPTHLPPPPLSQPSTRRHADQGPAIQAVRACGAVAGLGMGPEDDPHSSHIGPPLSAL